MASTIKVLYAEDHLPLRNSIVNYLTRDGFEVVGVAANGKELIQLMVRQHDVILLDLQMPIMDGSEFLDYVSGRMLTSKIVIVTMFYCSLLVKDMKSRGARGFLSKQALAANANLLTECIHKVAAGDNFFHHEVEQLRKLCASEQRIIAPLCNGRTNQQIAEKDHVTERAVEKRRKSLYNKVGADSKAAFFRFAFLRGLQYLHDPYK